MTTILATFALLAGLNLRDYVAGLDERGEAVQCERYSPTITRCQANGHVCYFDESDGGKACFEDIATVRY